MATRFFRKNEMRCRIRFCCGNKNFMQAQLVLPSSNKTLLEPFYDTLTIISLSSTGRPVRSLARIFRFVDLDECMHTNPK